MFPVLVQTLGQSPAGDDVMQLWKEKENRKGALEDFLSVL